MNNLSSHGNKILNDFNPFKNFKLENYKYAQLHKDHTSENFSDSSYDYNELLKISHNLQKTDFEETDLNSLKDESNELFLLFTVRIYFTLVGFGPTFDAALFLDTALRLCPSVILLAFANGTHFGYFLFASAFCFDRPHFLKPPPFFLEPMSTHFCLNHLSRPL